MNIQRQIIKANLQVSDDVKTIKLKLQLFENVPFVIVALTRADQSRCAENS